MMQGKQGRWSSGWFSRVATVAMAVFIGFALVASDVEARRLGGGKSFGRQSNTMRQQTPPAKDAGAQSAQQQGQAAQRPAGNRWLGPIAGIAAGLGIAALLSHLGLMGPFAEFLGSVLVIALLVIAAMFIWRLLRGAPRAGASQSGMEPAYASRAPEDRNRSAGSAYSVTPGSAMPGSVAAMSAGTAPQVQEVPWGIPADFDTPAFLRNAKVYFHRLQSAWDTRNLADIREFTTPEVYGEIKTQLEEDESPNQTDVETLDAQLLGIETNPADYLASVRFTGTIRENPNAPAEKFEEIWNLTKPKNGRSGWQLAGIQQVH
jgi:predicted lipid-binding transport protein (Tim44 family)